MNEMRTLGEMLHGPSANDEAEALYRRAHHCRQPEEFSATITTARRSSS